MYRKKSNSTLFYFLFYFIRCNNQLQIVSHFVSYWYRNGFCGDVFAQFIICIVERNTILPSRATISSLFVESSIKWFYGVRYVDRTYTNHSFSSWINGSARFRQLLNRIICLTWLATWMCCWLCALSNRTASNEVWRCATMEWAHRIHSVTW